MEASIQGKEKLIEQKCQSSQENGLKYKGDPYKEAGIFSKLFFCWIYKAIRISKTRSLELEFLGKIDESRSAENLSVKFIEYWNQHKGKKSLFKVILSYNSVKLFFFLIISLLITLIGGLNIMLIEQIILCFSENKPEFSLEVLILAYILFNILSSFMTRHLSVGQMLLSNKSAIEAISLVYNKIAIVSPSGPKKKAKEGEIVNYIQIDAEKLISYFAMAPLLISGPMQIIIYIVLLFAYFKLTFLAGLGTLIVFFVINSVVFSNFNKYNNEYLSSKDERMKFTTQIFNHLKILKLNSWEEFFQSKLNEKFAKELKSYRDLLGIFIKSIFIYWTSPVVASVSTFAAYFTLHSKLEPSVIYTGLTIFNGIQDPLRSIPFSYNAFFDLLVSMKRIEVSDICYNRTFC